MPLAVVTAVVLWVLWTRIADVGALKEALVDANWRLAAVALPLMALGLMLATARLQFVLRAMDYRVRFLLVFDAIISTWPLSVVAPSRVNEFLRAVVLRDSVPVVEGGGAVLAERVVDVQTLCVLAAIGGAAIGEWSLFAIAIGGALAVWAGGAALAIAPDWFVGLPLVRRFDDKFRRLISPFASLRAHPVLLAVVIACSVGVWLVAVSIASVLLEAFGASVAVADVLALWPLAVFVGLLPLTVSGMGTRDAAFVALLALAGREVVEAQVLSATMGYAVVATIVPSLVGIPWMIRQMSTFRRATTDE